MQLRNYGNTLNHIILSGTFQNTSSNIRSF